MARLSTGSGGGTSLSKASGADVDTGTDDAKYVTAKAITDSGVAFTSDIPAALSKASGSEVNTGTDDAKYVTAKAIADSNVALLSDIPAAWTTIVAAQSVGTGNDVVVSGLPTGWSEVLVKITALSFDASATQPLLQFVTSGGNIATGYSAYLATNTSMLPETTGIPVFWSSVAAVDVLKITVRIKRTGALTFEADGTGISAVRFCGFLGDITLASEATGLRLKASGSVNFDGGLISVYAR